MKSCRHLLSATAVACLFGAAAHAASITVSLGVRETGTTAAVGADGGTANGIEWIDLDLTSVQLDGAWHQVSFDLANPQSVTAFAGTTADSILASGKGTIEHIRFRNTDGITGEIQLYLDKLVHTSVTGGSTDLGWEGLTLGSEALFQEPGFSGSTRSHLADPSPAPVDPNTAAVTDAMAFEGTQSYLAEFQFVDGDPTRWLRFTTFAYNPTIELDSTISFYLKGGVIPEPTTIVLAGLSLAGLAACRRKM